VFGYGAFVPWVTRGETGDLLAIAGPDMLLLRTPIELRGEGIDDGRRLHGVGRSADAIRSHLRPLPLASSRSSGRRGCAAIHARILASVGEPLP